MSDWKGSEYVVCLHGMREDLCSYCMESHEHDRCKADLSRVTEERDQLRRERDWLKGDRDKFLASDDCYYWTPEAQAERDQLRRERDEAGRQCNQAKQDALNWGLEHSRAAADRDSLRSKLAGAVEVLEDVRGYMIVDGSDYMVSRCEEVLASLRAGEEKK